MLLIRIAFGVRLQIYKQGVKRIFIKSSLDKILINATDA